MHADQQPYRTLYDDMLDYDGSDLYRDVVQPWLREQDGERRWLDAFAARRGSPVPAASIEDRWHLYAFSRIVELLQLSFSPTPYHPGTWGTKSIGAEDYAELMSFFGLQRIDVAAFHPFFHEVVSVDPKPGPVTITKEYWHAYMLGPLMITRAGCAVAGDLNKDIAENSTLYWSFARRNRPTIDLSNGWGSNSQWRTEFRRDYLLEGARYYNVDGDGRERLEELTPEERVELLRHRCFVNCAKPDKDLWPYEERLVEP
jgi:hypothetical protein